MGQIIGRAAKPDACNLRSLSSYGTPAAGQHILVSTDNSAMQNGQGNFDAYVVGDGATAATALTLNHIADLTPVQNSKNPVSSGGMYESINGVHITEDLTPIKAANQVLCRLTLIKGVEYTFKFMSSVAETADNIYYGVKSPNFATTYVSGYIAKNKYEDTKTYTPSDNIDVAVICSFFIVPSTGQEITAQIDAANYGILDKLEDKQEQIDALQDEVRGGLIYNELLFSQRGVWHDVLTGLTLYKGMQYKIQYEAVDARYDSLTLRITDSNNNSITSFTPTELTQVLEFIPSTNYKNAKVRVIVFGGGTSYGNGVRITFEQLDGFANAINTIKNDVTTEQSRAISTEGQLDDKYEGITNGLQDQIDAITPTTITGDVTNAPDEEDLTSVGGLLRFKNNPYGVGFGTSFVRKNSNLASVISSVNTIYIIRYSHDLDGETLELPSNSVLFFDGGKIYNGTIEGDNSCIIAGNYQIFTDIVIDGTWCNGVVYGKWFDFASVEGQDDAANINSLMQLCNGSDNTKVYMPQGNIYTSVIYGSTTGAMIVPSNTTIMMQGCTLHVMPNNFERYNLILIRDVSDVKIFGGIIVGDKAGHTGATGEWGHGVKIGGAKNVVIEDLYSHDFWGDGLNIIEGTGDPSFISVSRCEFRGNRRNGISIEAGQNISLTKCVSSENGINGVNPKAGLDIEPWQAGEYKVKNISVIGCEFEGNAGIDTYVVALHSQNTTYDNDVFINGCSMGTLQLISGQKCYISDCDIKSSLIFSSRDGFIISDTCFKKSGTTAERPSANYVVAGFTYLDTDLGKLIMSNATAWVNLDGTAL